MSKEAYIRGFYKVAEANSYDPFVLARMALGFKRLKKAEARASAHELRKTAQIRLTASNLRNKHPSLRLSPSTYSTQDTASGLSGSPGFRRHGGEYTTTPVATGVQPMKPQKPAVTGNMQQASAKSTVQTPMTYDRFVAGAKSRGWKLNNGTWTSPNGQKFTDQSVRDRIVGRNASGQRGVAGFNSTVKERQSGVNYALKDTGALGQAARAKDKWHRDRRRMAEEVQNEYLGGPNEQKYRNLPNTTGGTTVLSGGKAYVVRNGRLVPAAGVTRQGTFSVAGRTLDTYGNRVRPYYRSLNTWR